VVKAPSDHTSDFGETKGRSPHTWSWGDAFTLAFPTCLLKLHILSSQELGVCEARSTRPKLQTLKMVSGDGAGGWGQQRASMCCDSHRATTDLMFSCGSISLV
jgi:hypothetical protein